MRHHLQKENEDNKRDGRRICRSQKLDGLREEQRERNVMKNRKNMQERKDLCCQVMGGDRKARGDYGVSSLKKIMLPGIEEGGFERKGLEHLGRTQAKTGSVGF